MYDVTAYGEYADVHCTAYVRKAVAISEPMAASVVCGTRQRRHTPHLGFRRSASALTPTVKRSVNNNAIAVFDERIHLL